MPLVMQDITHHGYFAEQNELLPLQLKGSCNVLSVWGVLLLGFVVAAAWV